MMYELGEATINCVHVYTKTLHPFRVDYTDNPN